MFKGFQNTGVFGTTVRTKQMFNSIPSTDFGQVGGIQGAIPSDGLVAWFNPQIVDSSNGITLNGSTVSSWKDTSGTHNLVQTTAASQPTYVQASPSFKGRNYLSFDTNDALAISASTLGPGTNPVYTVLSLHSFNAGQSGTSMVRYQTPGGAGAYGLILSTAGVDLGYYVDAAGQKNRTANLVTNNTMLLRGLEINRSAGILYYHYRNIWRFTSIAALTTLTDYNGSNFQLGPSTNGVIFMFDVLIYNRTIDATEYSSIFNYFNRIYGL